jgi:hypothetical protein
MEGLVAFNNVINKFRSRMSNNSQGNICEVVDFQRTSAGWAEYSKKFMQRVAIMKAHPRLEPVRPEGDVFDLNPAFHMDKFRHASFTCKLGDAMPDPSCHLTFHRFEALYEARNIAVAATNLKRVTPDQLTTLQHLLRMDIQYLAGCSVEWKAADGAPPAKTKPTAPRPEAAQVPSTSIQAAEVPNISILPQRAPEAPIPAGE